MPGPKSSTRKPRATSTRKGETVLDPLRADIASGGMETPEENTHSSRPPSQDDFLASAHSLIAEGNQNETDQQDPRGEIRDDAKQQAQPVAFADVVAPDKPDLKVWAQERSAPRAHESDGDQGSANPTYILAAITLGIPALIAIPLIAMNPSIQEGAFTNILAFVAVTAFVVAAIFEIKTIVDEPSQSGHH